MTAVPFWSRLSIEINPHDREPFLAAINTLARERRRDGAYAWRIFEDAAEEGRMVETFVVNPGGRYVSMNVSRTRITCSRNWSIASISRAHQR